MDAADANAPDSAVTETIEPAKVGVQVDLLKRILGESGIDVGVALGEGRGVDFIYQAGVILVQDTYLDEVRYLLRRGEAGQPPAALERVSDDGGRLGTVEGITLYSLAGTEFAGDTLGALALIDRVLGTGVATPNHILSVTPVVACPATEPTGVPAGSQPDPGPGDQGGGGVYIYVPDTGLIRAASHDPGWQASHPWLAGVTGAPDEAVTGGLVHEYGCHGTFIAGVARCMAPSARIHVSNDFTTAGAISEFKLVRELFGALGKGVNIISLSAGCSTRLNLPLLSFTGFWRRYISYKGVLLVAAAGNNSSSRPFWPAAFPQVIGVGALSADRRTRAYFSDYGPWVDVYAPGEDLVNAYAVGLYKYREPPRIGEEHMFGGMARWSGTSFATPLVAGLIAARMTRTGEAAPRAADALLATARAQQIPGLGPVLRGGR
jgi:subtilisin family serine protease